MRLAMEVMPGLGFDRALVACERVGGNIDLEAPEAFAIGAAAPRALGRVAAVVDRARISEVAHLVFSLPSRTGRRDPEQASADLDCELGQAPAS